MKKRNHIFILLIYCIVILFSISGEMARVATTQQNTIRCFPWNEDTRWARFGHLQTVITKIVAPERVAPDIAHMDPGTIPRALFYLFLYISIC